MEKINDNYFTEYLKKKEKYFDTINFAVNKRLKAYGENDKGVQNGLLMLAQNQKEYLYASISAGKSISDIRERFKIVIESSERFWDADESYVDLLWIVSIGILLDVDDTHLLLIKSMIEKHKMHDKLVDFMIHSRDEGWHVSESYFMKKPYAFWDGIICTARNDKIDLIKSYLQNDWYTAHKDLYWYDLHKSKNNTYVAYWSFETGAGKVIGN